MNTTVKFLRTVLRSGLLSALAVSCAYSARGSDLSENEYASRGGLVLDNKRVPISEELQEFLKSEGYSAVTLINDKGKVKIVNSAGQPIEPCGRIIGTKVTGNCDLEDINLVNLNDISILVSESSPKKKCTASVGGWLVKIC